MPHKLEYLFGKNGHSWRVFWSSSITICLIMAVNRKRVGVENRQLKWMGGHRGLNFTSFSRALSIVYRIANFSVIYCQICIV